MSEEDYIEALRRKIENDNFNSVNSNVGLSSNSQTNLNLIEFQLDFTQNLEKIERLLKGMVLKFDSKGNEKWVSPENKSMLIFNEIGVQEIMRVCNMYLDKNLVLSNYTEEEIINRVNVFGNEISDLIFLNYDEFGMDSEYKRKHYSMVVMAIVDMVESAFRRSIGGAENNNLRTARMVTQTETNQRLNQNLSQGNPEQKFSIFKPKTWI